MVALIQIQCLEAVITARSFRRAAISLHMSEPAVSGHVARLEQELQLKLIDRSRRGSVLTDEGVRLLPRLRAFEAAADAIQTASDSVRRDRRPALSIGITPSSAAGVLPSALSFLRERFGDLVVHVHQCSQTELYDLLRGGVCELVIADLQESDVVPADIDETAVMVLRDLGVCGRTDAPLVIGSGPLAVAELYDQPLVLVRDDSRMAVIDRILPSERRGFTCVVDDVGTAMMLIGAGTGYGLLAMTSTMFVPQTLLRWRALDGATPQVSSLLTVRDAELSPPARAFALFVTSWMEQLRGRLSFDDSIGAHIVSPPSHGEVRNGTASVTS